MAWTWRFEKADGSETEPAVAPEEFPTQGDAESWIGEVWKELNTESVYLIDSFPIAACDIARVGRDAPLDRAP